LVTALSSGDDCPGEGKPVSDQTLHAYTDNVGTQLYMSPEQVNTLLMQQAVLYHTYDLSNMHMSHIRVTVKILLLVHCVLVMV